MFVMWIDKILPGNVTIHFQTGEVTIKLALHFALISRVLRLPIRYHGFNAICFNTHAKQWKNANVFDKINQLGTVKYVTISHKQHGLDILVPLLLVVRHH